jgi:hypothetical protein
MRFHILITFVNDNNSHLGFDEPQNHHNADQTQTLESNPVYNLEPIIPDSAGYRTDTNHARRNPQ